MTTKEYVKRGFDILGLNLGDIIEVQLIGAISKKAKFKITEEVYETSHFPLKLPKGEVVNCHLDHIEKSSIKVISRAKK